MAEYYRKLLSNETAYLTEHITKYNKILEDSAEQLTESVIGQLHLAIGQSNLFINERFKQFTGLIDDCELKRGEKEIKVEDLAGFWDMIYYQVEDLKTKYGQLETLEKNKWVAEEVPVESTAKSLKPAVSNGNKNKRTVPSKTSPTGHLKNSSTENGTSTVDGAVKKPAGRSNFREFLKNKRKEVTTNGTTNGVTNGTASSTITNGVTTNGALSNGTHHHLNGHHKEVHNGTTNGHHLNGSSLESQKLKALTETMSRHSLTTPGLIDETNKEN